LPKDTTSELVLSPHYPFTERHYNLTVLEVMKYVIKRLICPTGNHLTYRKPNPSTKNVSKPTRNHQMIFVNYESSLICAFSSISLDRCCYESTVSFWPHGQIGRI